MAFTIKLQSPAYDNNGNGEEIALPVSFDTLEGASMAEILTLFEGENEIFDFAQLREVVQLGGFLTEAAATEAGFDNPVHMRDRIRRTRTVWPTQSPVTATWNDATLPAAERDAAATARAQGLARLIYEKAWDSGGAAYTNFFLYGTVGDYRFGPRAAASGRVRIPFVITFLVGNVSTGA